MLTRDAREGIAGFGGELLPRDAREARGRGSEIDTVEQREERIRN